MLWKKKTDESQPEKVPETTQTQQPPQNNDSGLEDLQGVLNDALNSKSAASPKSYIKETAEGTSLREIASRRAEALALERFPKEMSCLTAMDELMECMSLGGQVRNYYRYGDFSMCDKQSEKLNFCFSNSLNAGEVKEKNIQEFYKSRLMEQLKHGSSEDVWEARN